MRSAGIAQGTAKEGMEESDELAFPATNREAKREVAPSIVHDLTFMRRQVGVRALRHALIRGGQQTKRDSKIYIMSL